MLFPSPTPSFPLLLGLGKGGANLLGVGFPLLGRATPLAGPLLLTPLYIRKRGAPHRHNNSSLNLLAMCSAPSTMVLDNIVAVLRRIPAMVEHQDRHHAVVLTELSHKAWLDRSPRDVIELSVC